MGQIRPTSLQGGETHSIPAPATQLLTTSKKNPPAILDLPTRIQSLAGGFLWPSVGIEIIVWLETVQNPTKWPQKNS